MERSLIILPDGTEIFSGLGGDHAIQTISHTSSVNKGMELTLGSVCSDMLEVKLFTPNRNLSITVGSEVAYYTVSEDGSRKKVGIFRLETPERTSRNTYKFIAYDRVSWLDKDMTSWVKELDGWPYSLFMFAQMVCDACLLTLSNEFIKNGNFPVNKFKPSKCTGRDLLSWIGEISASFCRATPDGEIEFAWYQDNDLQLEHTGENFYYSGSLKYEDYLVETVDVVQVQMADSEDGLLFPDAADSANRYVITGNPLITFVNESLLPYLKVIQLSIRDAVYSPCRVSIPCRSDIRPGEIIRIKDADGYLVKTYVMTRTQRGNKMNLESVGYPRRNSAKSVVDQDSTDQIADEVMKRLTQTAIFNKLTNNGTVEGFFLGEDGQIYINATYLSTGIMQSKDGSTFFLDLDQGILKMNASELTVGGKELSEAALNGMTQESIVKVLTADGAAEGIVLIDGQLYINASYINSGELNADLLTAGVLQSKDGEAFRLNLETGEFHMEGTGKFKSADGKSYITVSGNEFVLYSKAGSDSFEEFVQIARIGFTEDIDGNDFPYFMLGNEERIESDMVGLFKMFDNGIYIGNSAPINAVGEFKGMEGAIGMFVDVANRKNYLVEGTSLTNSFTAVFG